MFKKILTYSIVAILTLTLIGGSAVILARPNEADAHNIPAALGGARDRGANREQGVDYDESGRGFGGNNGQGAYSDHVEQGGGYGNGGQGQGQGADSAGTGYGGGAQANDRYTTPVNWETITGVVLVSDSELTVNTSAGEIVVGLGQSWYREEQGFEVNVGDEVTVEGYYEDGEFKAGTVENLTTGTSVVLRDATGRPGWAGRGQRSNSAAAPAGQGTGGGYDQSTGSGSYGQGMGKGPAAAQPGVVPDAGDVAPLDCPICDAATSYTGVLSEDEVTALLLALNDEYHAWAVYEQVITDFGAVRPFPNIQNAEAQHIRALLRLFETYDIAVPENPWIGAVDSFESLGAACTAGVEAEVANGALYGPLFASTDRDDILGVYSALQRASVEQHLPAFSRCAE